MIFCYTIYSIIFTREKAYHDFGVSQFAHMGFIGASLQKFCQVTPSWKILQSLIHNIDII